MSGNKIGGLKARDSNYENHGQEFYKVIGRKGGMLSRGGGFQKGAPETRLAGMMGGSIGRRNNKLTQAEKLEKKRQVAKLLNTKAYREELHNDQRARMAALARKWANK